MLWGLEGEAAGCWGRGGLRRYSNLQDGTGLQCRSPWFVFHCKCVKVIVGGAAYLVLCG